MMILKEISNKTAKAFIRAYHYAKSSPSTVSFSHGAFFDNELIGVTLWGFGTRPLHTIKKLFPSLGTSDYLELCRFCVHDKMPKNTETQILRLSREMIRKRHPNIKVLFSWADGMRGKPGFVYQADNWLYGGFIKSEFYTNESGEVIHPRLLITRYKKRDKSFTESLGLRKIKGPQFRYVHFLCSKGEMKRLLRETTIDWKQKYPKMSDIFTESIIAGEVSRETCCATSTKGTGRFRDPAYQSNMFQFEAKI